MDLFAFRMLLSLFHNGKQTGAKGYLKAASIAAFCVVEIDAD